MYGILLHVRSVLAIVNPHSVRVICMSALLMNEFTVNESPKAPTTAISYGVSLLTLKKNFK